MSLMPSIRKLPDFPELCSVARDSPDVELGANTFGPVPSQRAQESREPVDPTLNPRSSIPCQVALRKLFHMQSPGGPRPWQGAALQGAEGGDGPLGLSLKAPNDPSRCVWGCCVP